MAVSFSTMICWIPYAANILAHSHAKDRNTKVPDTIFSDKQPERFLIKILFCSKSQNFGILSYSIDLILDHNIYIFLILDKKQSI